MPNEQVQEKTMTEIDSKSRSEIYEQRLRGAAGLAQITPGARIVVNCQIWERPSMSEWEEAYTVVGEVTTNPQSSSPESLWVMLRDEKTGKEHLHALDDMGVVPYLSDGHWNEKRYTTLVSAGVGATA